LEKGTKGPSFGALVKGKGELWIGELWGQFSQL